VTEAGEYDDRLELAATELERLVRRARGLTSRSWPTRRHAVETALTRMEQLGRERENRVGHPVPELPDYALADALAVLGGDVIESLARVPPDPAQLDRLLSEIRGALDATS
jgi:hypothetical protein